MRVFNLIWAGQAVSIIGTAFTVFGIGVWVFERTDSPTAFATLVMAGSLPGVLVLPFAGVLTDRWDRRRVMLLSDLGTAVGPLVALALHSAGALRVWQVYVLVACSAVFQAFQWPAFSSLVPQLVGKELLSKANSRVSLAEGGGLLFGPLLGGALYAVSGLDALLLVDFASFCLAVAATLWSYRLLPALPPGDSGAARLPLRVEMTEGWRFIRPRPALLALLVFFACYNLLMELALVLVAPLVLSAHSSSTLGLVNAAAALGLIIVSGVMSVVRQPRRLVRTLLLVAALHSVLLLVIGAGRGDLWLLAAGTFAVSGAYAVTNATTTTLWQRKTPAAVQGRVAAVRRMVAWSAYPMAHALAGPVAVQVGEPLADAAGWGGTEGGRGPGIAMVFLLSGLLLAAVVTATSVPRTVRRLERELPDADEPKPEARPRPAATAS